MYVVFCCMVLGRDGVVCGCVVLKALISSMRETHTPQYWSAHYVIMMLLNVW